MLKKTMFILAVLAIVDATRVNKCDGGEPYEDTNQVKISGCDEPPCKLKRRTRPSVEENFVPDRDIDSLVTSVHASILGVPLPFIGVDGMSACDNIFDTEGNKVGCPLKKGVEYVHKNSFPVLQVYPTVSMIIHYGLNDASGPVACFEVPAKITN